MLRSGQLLRKSARCIQIRYLCASSSITTSSQSGKGPREKLAKNKNKVSAKSAGPALEWKAPKEKKRSGRSSEEKEQPSERIQLKPAPSTEMTEDAKKLLQDHELRDLIDPLGAAGYTTIRKLAALREEEFPVRTSELQNFREMVMEAKLQERNLQRFFTDLKMRHSVRSLEALAAFDVNNLKKERPGFEPISEDEATYFKAMQTDIIRVLAPFSALRPQEATSHELGEEQVQHGAVGSPRERPGPFGKLTEEAMELLNKHRFRHLVDKLPRLNCTTMTDLAGLTWKDVEQDLRPFEVGRFDEMILVAKLKIKLESYGFGRYFDALREMGIHSLGQLAGIKVASLKNREGFGDLNVESFLDLLKSIRDPLGIHTVDLTPIIAGNQEKAFNDYIRVGKEMIRSSSSSALVVKEIENALGGKQHGDQLVRDMASYTFFALLAPSLSGKTQLAFALRDWRPLYFAFGQGNAEDAQWIYQCFSPLNGALSTFSNLDLATCGIKKDNRNYLKSLDKVTRKSLLEHHESRPLLVLGLLRALILDGMGFPDNNTTTWMEYYLRPRDLAVKPISIRDFNSDSTVKEAMKKHIFFVDEFAGDANHSIPCAFIRSLAKCVDIRFLGAGTNTRISNLVGLDSASASGINRNHLWCVVLPHMPPLCNPGGLPSSFGGNVFLRAYLQHQIEVSRGGISAAIIDTVAKETDDDNAGIFGRVINYVKKTIVERKDGLRRLESNQALVSMFLSNFYDKFAPFSDASSGSPSEARKPLSSSRSPKETNDVPKGAKAVPPRSQTEAYLNYHYFKIRIPWDCVSGRFIPTYVSSGGLIKYGTSSKESESSDTTRSTIDNYTKKWAMQSCFDENEEILQIACFLVEMSGPLVGDLRPIYNVVDAKGARPDVRFFALAQPSNPHAPKLDGLALENLVHYAIIDSSHRGQEQLRGIGLFPFLERIVANFEKSDTLSVNRLENSTDPRHEGSLDRLLELTQGLAIPFLNAADLKWSDGLINFAKSCNGRVNFGHYDRHADPDGVDGTFELMDTSDSADWYRFAAVECKNWKDSVSVWNYVGILEKGLAIVRALHQPDNKPRTLLHFSFVKDLTKFRESSKSQDTAKENKWCAFGIRKIRNIDGSWTPVVETLIPPPPHPERPAVVGIVIVTD